MVDLDSTTLFEGTKRLNYTYARQTCVSLCTQMWTNRTCGCANYDLGAFDWLDQFEWCVSDEQLRCAHSLPNDNEKNSDTENGMFDIKRTCLAKCPLECHRRSLLTSPSFYVYPTLADALQIARRSNESDGNYMTNVTHLMSNLVSINVYYETLGYTMIDERVKTSVEAFVGSLGGIFHLFLGMSVIGCAELTELVITACFIFCKSCRKN